jgi:hypothetical protein
MKTPIPSSLRSKGFALVVTISLLVLLSAIALGFLSLSAVTLRSGSQEKAQMEARANARLALQIAIGELQKQLGPDQRVSANGAILSESPVRHPHWTGAWDSWIAGSLGTAAVESDYPSAVSDHQTIGSQPDASMRPEYAQKDKHFRSWLVSLAPDEAGNMASARDLVLNGKAAPTKDDQAIHLVGKGSLGDAADAVDFVSARLIDVTSPTQGRGRYAWWAGDESQKARVMHDSYVSTPPANSAEKIYRGQSSGSTGTRQIKDLEDITIAQEARLKGLPTRNTLDLVVNETGKEPAKKNFHSATAFSQSVLSDVREGGLKRDLSTILEQPILRTNTGPEYMLYQFDDPRFPGDRSHSRVPIQDLAAFYQLYDNDPSFSPTTQRREGVRYTSTERANAIQLRTPDFDGGGTTPNRQRYLREYTALYKQPVLTKVQFLLAIGAQAITQAERKYIQDRHQGLIGPQWPVPFPIRDEDTHKLRLGVMPMLTFWNPNNVPLVLDRRQNFMLQNPGFALRFRKIRPDGSIYDGVWTSLTYLTEGNRGLGDEADGAGGFGLLKLRIAEQPIVFEPGEVKVISLPLGSAGTLKSGGVSKDMSEEWWFGSTQNHWDPNGLFLMPNSGGGGHGQAPNVYNLGNVSGAKESLVFNGGDKITYSFATEDPSLVDQFWGNNGSYRRRARALGHHSDIYGSIISFSMFDAGYERNPYNDFLRHHSVLSRIGSEPEWPARKRVAVFNRDLIKPGMPGGVELVQFDNSSNAFSGQDLINRSNAGDAQGIMDFTLSIGCEAGTAAAGGLGGGRRIASRPFLHSATGAPSYIDRNEKQSLYNYGWNWQLTKINDVEDSIVTAEPGTGRGFYGGGYTSEHGTTHVVQRDIPVLPAISIASLSHAHLGGFSLGYSNIVGTNPETDTFMHKSSQVSRPTDFNHQRVSAWGQGGLAPHIVQAIGNSYAHPNVPSDKAVTTWNRLFKEVEAPAPNGGEKIVPFVDHSYLANKALWDEYFFSSIAPQPSKVPLYGGANLTAKQVADRFFKLDDPLASSPLANRRIKPYSSGLSQMKLDELFTQSGLFGNSSDQTKNGLADKIAAHLMVEGAFNVNSTSVQAWKVFLSSLKGKPIAYLDGGTVPKEAQTEGTPISAGGLPNAAPILTEDVSKPAKRDQLWKTGRELTDAEIDELAEAMVKQVKRRGPFLSLSEFVNRRLDAANPELSVKGALQAALDDPAVSINKDFRTPGRILDSEFTDTERNAFAFPDAAKGPVAYGSMPYVDQADVLRGFAEQITARGDTFVIRTYGDSIDASGNVVARAWCEAVVQRLPEYVNPVDVPHLKQADPTLSEQSRIFGRNMQIVSFRWLDSKEV